MEYYMENKYKPHLSKKESLQNNELYYQEYRKVYDLSLTLTTQIDSANYKQQQLMHKINKFSDKIEDLRDPIRKKQLEKKRKQRRTSNQINKEFGCEIPNCLKEYATIASLKIHRKLKHPNVYNSDGE